MRRPAAAARLQLFLPADELLKGFERRHAVRVEHLELVHHRVLVEDGEKRAFRFGSEGEWFEHVRSLPFAYRADEVVSRLRELGAGRVVTKLEMLHRLEG